MALIEECSSRLLLEWTWASSRIFILTEKHLICCWKQAVASCSKQRLSLQRRHQLHAFAFRCCPLCCFRKALAPSVSSVPTSGFLLYSEAVSSKLCYLFHEVYGCLLHHVIGCLPLYYCLLCWYFRSFIYLFHFIEYPSTFSHHFEHSHQNLAPCQLVFSNSASFRYIAIAKAADE